MSPVMFVHHVNCPKCHGIGSYFEGPHIEGNKFVGNYVFNCNCFEHIKAEREQSKRMDSDEQHLKQPTLRS